MSSSNEWEIKQYGRVGKSDSAIADHTGRWQIMVGLIWSRWTWKRSFGSLSLSVLDAESIIPKYSENKSIHSRSLIYYEHEGQGQWSWRCVKEERRGKRHLILSKLSKLSQSGGIFKASGADHIFLPYPSISCSIFFPVTIDKPRNKIWRENVEWFLTMF